MDVSYEGTVINRPVPPVYEEELVAEPHLSNANTDLNGLASTRLSIIASVMLMLICLEILFLPIAAVSLAVILSVIYQTCRIITTYNPVWENSEPPIQEIGNQKVSKRLTCHPTS